MAKVTIQSIAKDLGLSRNTVSMALKGNDLVAPRTREMVMRYAQQAGYENHLYDCWQIVSEDKKESLVTWIQVMCGPSRQSHIVRLKGLDEGAVYQVEEVGGKEED